MQKWKQFFFLWLFLILLLGLYFLLNIPGCVKVFDILLNYVIFELLYSTTSNRVVFSTKLLQPLFWLLGKLYLNSIKRTFF